jgi:glycine betaine/proline transport system ATP-binding protein
MSDNNNSVSKISCRGIWKVFGPHSDRIMATLDENSARREVQERTGHVIGVKNVSFDVQQGETFVVMGLSGSGKSTLVRCMSRLVEPTAGQVVIDGDDVVSMNERQLIELRRNKMSMVFQHFGLLPHRRVIDNIAYGLEVQGISKTHRHETAGKVLEMVGLGGWDQHYPRELSGGMQQRVGLARALAVDPEIMLFDEPFSALDPLIRREMQDELLKLQDVMHKTMIFITHDFLEAIKMGDHIAIMKDGEIVQVGTPEDVVANPVNDYVRDFSEDVPRHKVLTASKIMAKGYPTVSASDTVASALTRMRDNSAQAVFVVGPSGDYVGTLGRSAAENADNTAQVSGVACAEESISPNTLIDKLINRVATTDVPVPVVDEKNALVGAVDRSAIMLALEEGGS